MSADTPEPQHDEERLRFLQDWQETLDIDQRIELAALELTAEYRQALAEASSALAGVQRQNEQQRKGLEYGVWELGRLYEALIQAGRPSLASGVRKLKERLAAVVAGAEP